ncbi:MAG: hypothetical protein ACREA9_13315 [Pyrinomonadaceae bacterium]
MKRFVMAVALACVLSGTALAGNIPTGGAPSPSGDTAIAGNIPTSGAPSLGGETQTPSAIATIILTILSIIR